jgi:hypothetical protein
MAVLDTVREALAAGDPDFLRKGCASSPTR